MWNLPDLSHSAERNVPIPHVSEWWTGIGVTPATLLPQRTAARFPMQKWYKLQNVSTPVLSACAHVQTRRCISLKSTALFMSNHREERLELARNPKPNSLKFNLSYSAIMAHGCNELPM